MADRDGMTPEAAARLGEKQWIPKELQEDWEHFVLGAGLDRITTADLDALARYFVLRHDLSQRCRDGAPWGTDEIRLSGEMHKLATSLRLTRQAIDKKRVGALTENPADPGQPDDWEDEPEEVPWQ